MILVFLKTPPGTYLMRRIWMIVIYIVIVCSTESKALSLTVTESLIRLRKLKVNLYCQSSVGPNTINYHKLGHVLRQEIKGLLCFFGFSDLWKKSEISKSSPITEVNKKIKVNSIQSWGQKCQERWNYI